MNLHGFGQALQQDLMVGAGTAVDLAVLDVVIEFVQPKVTGPNPPAFDPGIAKIHRYPLDIGYPPQGFDNRLLKPFA